MKPSLPLLAAQPDARLAEALFDRVPGVVFFEKDAAGRYVAVNWTLVERCGCATKAEVIGRTVADFFPAELARAYAAQDRHVLRTGRAVLDQLELHLYRDRRPGWCLTSKLPVRDAAGRVTGLAGVSRDLAEPGEVGAIPAEVAKAVRFLQENFDQPLTTRRLAAQAGMTGERFARAVKRIFHVTPGQLLIQTRLQEATRRLRETDARVAEIAVACGFYDHSAFTRQFKSATRLTPRAYRESARWALTPTATE